MPFGEVPSRAQEIDGLVAGGSECAGQKERVWEPLEDWVRTHGNDSQLLRAVIMMIDKEGGTAEVLRVARRLAAKPGHDEVLQSLADNLIDYGRFTKNSAVFETALAVTTQLTALRPKDVTALSTHASALQWLERWEEAIAAWRRVVKADPGNPATWINLSRCEAVRPDGFAKAVSALEEGVPAMKDKAGRRRLYKEAGQLCEREGVNPCRKENLRRAVEFYRLAHSPADMQRTNQWIKQCKKGVAPPPPPEKAVEVDPCPPDVSTGLQLLHGKQGLRKTSLLQEQTQVGANRNNG